MWFNQLVFLLWQGHTYVMYVGPGSSVENVVELRPYFHCRDDNLARKELKQWTSQYVGDENILWLCVN